MRKRFSKHPLSDVAMIERGKFSARPRNDPQFYGGNIPFLQTGDIARAGHRIITWEQTLNERGLAVSRLFPSGTIFMSIAANVGDVAISTFEAACPDSVVAVTPKEEIDKEWLFQTLKMSKASLASLATQNAQANLSLEKIAPFKVHVPSLAEQRKIAEFLGTWDEAITRLTMLHAATRQKFRGLSQQLLGRSGLFPKHWDLQPLSSIVTRVRRQNGGGDHPVMTISAKSGFLMQSDKFSRDMAGSSVERYVLLHHGEFAYNKGNSQTAPYGCIFPLNRPTALVPFVYFCFSLNESFNRNFYSHLFAAGALNHQLSQLINSGVRNDGLLNLDPDDFFACKVPVPPSDMQEKIADALTAAKVELGLLKSEINVLTRQKSGLMQKLLTGEWRVNVDAQKEAAE
jgi:type I restriction enzyme, S subunit